MADEEVVEKSFLGKHRDKMWTYLILMGLLIGIVIAVNVVWKDPTRAEEGIKSFLGLPGWALATITFVIGAVVFWLGLKVETDWPEFVGAFLVAGAITVFELLFGWQRLEFGLVVVPYVIPLLVFVVMIIVAVKRTV